VALVLITEDHVGWDYANGRVLEKGLVPGTREIPGAHEIRGAPTHRDSDDNERRTVGAAALYDWCLGGDDQWIYESVADERLYGHDLGHWLGGDWGANDPTAQLNTPKLLTGGWNGLDAGATIDFAIRLEGISRDSLRLVLSQVPTSWPVNDDQLERLGFFLEERAKEVARRLRAL
jgi:hypothetical protein